MKYAWVKPLIDKKANSVLNGFIAIVNGPKLKPNELWFDQGRELYNKLMQKWLDDNILMCLTHSEVKSVVAERFIRTFKDKIYKKWQLMLVNLMLVMNTIILIIFLSVKNLFILIILLCLKNLNRVIKLIKYQNIFSKG